MTNDKVFVASITIYSNHITTCRGYFPSFKNAKESIKTFPKMTLLRLLIGKYGKNGDFIYKIEVKQ